MTKPLKCARTIYFWFSPLPANFIPEYDKASKVRLLSLDTDLG
jgi:hypothetical protein